MVSLRATSKHPSFDASVWVLKRKYTVVVSLIGVSDYPVEITNWYKVWFTGGIGYRPDDGFPNTGSGLSISSENLNLLILSIIY